MKKLRNSLTTSTSTTLSTISIVNSELTHALKISPSNQLGEEEPEHIIEFCFVVVTKVDEETYHSFRRQ
jgi:hypothetical protein